VADDDRPAHERVRLEIDGPVAVVTNDNPAKHNAFDDAMDLRLFEILGELRSRPDVRAVVWRGEGRSFSSGRDVGALGGASSGLTHHELMTRGHRGIQQLFDLDAPVLVALRGWSIGASFQRALLCDIRVAGESVAMALPAVDHGLIPDSAGVAKLFEIGGSALALDLALTGRRIGAEEALQLGLVTQVVPDDELDEVVLGLAESIAERPPLAVRMIREHVQALASADVRATLQRELTGQAMMLGSHDYREHLRARAEDREPTYERR
jgi:enoyl-CoA hydratase